MIPLPETYISLTFKHIKYTLSSLFDKLNYAQTVYSSSETRLRTREIEIIHCAIPLFLRFIYSYGNLVDFFVSCASDILQLECSCENLDELEIESEVKRLFQGGQDFSILEQGDLTIEIHKEIYELIGYLKHFLQLTESNEDTAYVIDDLINDFTSLSNTIIRLSVLPLPDLGE